MQTLSDQDADLKYITDITVQVSAMFFNNIKICMTCTLLPVLHLHRIIIFFPLKLHPKTWSSEFLLSWHHWVNLFFFFVQLNAFDSRHLDEIHFDVRLMAFQKCIKYIKEMSVLDIRYLTAIMHNCFHSFQVSMRSHFYIWIQIQDNLSNKSKKIKELLTNWIYFFVSLVLYGVHVRLGTCLWQTAPLCVSQRSSHSWMQWAALSRTIRKLFSTLY